MPSFLRFFVFIFVATTFYVVALNNEIYTIASPPSMGYHIVLRKLESIVAFVIVATSMNWWLMLRRPRAVLALCTAAYSALIEIGQRLSGSHEQLAESLFDVACGAAGGYIAGLLARTLWKRARDRSTGAR